MNNIDRSLVKSQAKQIIKNKVFVLFLISAIVLILVNGISAGVTLYTSSDDLFGPSGDSSYSDNQSGQNTPDDFFKYFNGDDPAVIGGVAFFHGQPVTVLAQEKGEGTKENIARNFGMVSPEGYWKSLRLMQQAEKFHRPVICLVDTPGAFCGLEAEERGQGEAIAKNLYTLAGLTVPVLSIVIGEGGSGGALALAVADEVWMLEHSVYSILSPEGFASILWKDSKKAKEAAAVMKLTAADLYQMGMIEHVIPETEPVNRENINDATAYLENGIVDFLEKYGQKKTEKLLEHRYERFRKM